MKFDLTPLEKVRLVTGARGDIFTLRRASSTSTPRAAISTATATKARPNVKANLILGPWAQTEFFGNFGTGFHSNDARAVIPNPDLDALPTATGLRVRRPQRRILPRTEFFATYWVLDLKSELVFVGDEGTTEAQGPHATGRASSSAPRSGCSTG